MHVSLHEAPTVVEKRGFGVLDVIASVFFASLVTSAVCLATGYQLAERQKDREFEEFKARHVIYELAPSGVPDR